MEALAVERRLRLFKNWFKSRRMTYTPVLQTRFKEEVVWALMMNAELHTINLQVA